MTSRQQCILPNVHSLSKTISLTDTHTVKPKSPCTIRSVWSKTTLITGCVGGAGMDPPSCKMDTFFSYLGPWLLVCQFIEIYKQMELHAKTQTLKKNY